LEKYLEEQKGEATCGIWTRKSSTDLLNYILSLAPKVRTFVPAIRQIVSQLEMVSDKIEELIP
jgi:hypothetical protein